MICELFPFQKQAVNEMRLRVAMALNNYRMLKIPQVVSLQAPTGSGKTIIMSALIEDIFYGSEQFTEQPEAIFVWLSDSPQLNEQSKQKIELKADKVRMDQCVVISDESFDREILEDGHIYFLNTQKLGKAGNLSRHSDTRQYTIWETIENTAREKADRLYFIIDEAHRGMQGRQAGTATTIMQRFIKGSSEQNLSPIPVVIGMSATAERFNSLVGQATNSTLHKVVISPAQVRQSGLLKDRIVITYPEDPIKHGDMAVLQAATDEWQDKCKHWYQYTYEQHYTNVNPVFVIQVCAGSSTKVSDTDLDDVIAKIEERMGDSFKENEVVHTFGSTGTLSIHGLTVPHVEPSEIAEDRRIRVVLFKENLSTGWDCPRAETMMSFRRAEDATYIAQLLGRMVRTPLQCHVLVDDSLNDVRLFLPYFNQDTVQKVIDELQATEGGEIPTVVDGESLEDQTYDTWSVHNQRKKTQKQTVGQLSIFDYPNGFQEEPAVAPSTAVDDMPNSGAVAANQGGADAEIPAEGHRAIPLDTVSGNDVHTGRETEVTNEGNQSVNKEQPVLTPAVSQMSMLPTIDREGITKFINEQGYLTYIVRAVKINSYLKSLMSLAGLLSQFNICITAAEDVKNDVAELIRNYVNGLHDAGKYDELTKQVMEMKLSVQIFDVFGEKIQSDNQIDMFTASESDLDRQLRVADAKMGGCGFRLAYGRKYIDFDNPNAFKVDCIDLFAGAGGLSEGFIQAGFSPVPHVEMNPYAAQTLETRTGYYYLKAQGKLDIYKDYISGKITRDEFLQHIPEEQLQSVFCETMSNETLPRLFENIDRILTQRGIKQVDVIIGGPPCQAYSLVGRAQSKHMETPMSADPRNDLYKLYARFLQKYQPKMFVFENVMGIKSANGGATWLKVQEALRSVGYEIECHEQNSKNFGVLQNRRRMIIVGWLKNSGLSYPQFEQTIADATVNDILSDLPALQPGGKSGEYRSDDFSDYLRSTGIRKDSDILTHHCARPNKDRDIEIYRRTIELWNDGHKRLNYNDLPDELKTHKNRKSFLDRFKVVEGDEAYCHTMLAHISKDGHYFIHPDIEQHRSITVREAARIQSFPDDYFFEGPRTAQFVQIGNAVPTLMAKGIAEGIANELSKEGIDGKQSPT